MFYTDGHWMHLDLTRLWVISFENITLLRELAFNKVFVLWGKVIYNLGGFPFEVICLVERGSGAGL